jgi:hypothetical protein
LGEPGFFASIPVSLVIAWVRVSHSWREELTWIRGVAAVFALPLVWLAAYFILMSGPREIGDWFFD